MELRVLGPLEVLRDGEPLALGPPQRRALLALLSVHAPRVVPVDRIIDELWGDAPAARAPHAIQVHVSALRKLLGRDDPDLGIETHPAGYALRAAPGVLDAGRFEALVGRAQAVLAEGDLGARAHFAEALALWRGAPFAGLEAFGFARAEATRLGELRLAALEARIGIDLALGHHRAVIAELHALVREHPWQEGLWAHLMTALARSGRQADALAAYRRHRRDLDEQLGLAPGPELRALEASILRDGVPPAPAGPASAPAGPRLPGALTLALAGGDLIGRDAELAALAAAARATRDGVLRLRLVTGEPGIGKSRLVAALAEAVVAEGATVLYGACMEDPRPPYAPFIDLVEHDLREAGDAAVRRRLGEDGAQLARIVGSITERLGIAPATSGASPRGDQLRLFAAVAGYLRRAADPRAVVVLEDLHWAAPATLALVGHLVRTARGAILIVATTRDAAPELTPELSTVLADLQRLPGVERVALDGLTRDDVAAVLRATARRPRPDVERTAAVLHDATDGSPLFLRELIRELPEHGLADGLTFSPSIRDHVHARFARLPPEDADVLDMCAVLGATFDARPAAQALGRPLTEVLDALDRAAALGTVAGVPAAPGRFAFTHAVLREVRYAAIPPGRRMSMHRAAGHAVRAGGEGDGVIADLARHFCAAAPLGDAEDAFRYARLAAHHARERLAFADAAAQLERAERVGALLPALDDATRCELAIERGEALHRAGDPRHREVLLGAAANARRAGGYDLLVRTALALSEQGWSFSIGRADDEVLDVARAARAALPPGRVAERARLTAMLAAGTHLTERHEEARGLATEALADARAAGDPAALAEALVTAHWACFDPLDVARRLAWAEEARGLAEATGDPVALGQALRMLGQDRLEVADLAGGRPLLERAARIADELDVAYLRVWGPASLAAVAALDDRLGEAARLIGECAALCRRIGVDAPTSFGGTGGALLIEHGLWERGVELITPIVERTAGMSAYLAALAMYHARLGDHEAARRCLEPFLESDFAVLPRNIQWAPGMVLLADAVTHLRDVDAAERVRQELLPAAEHTAWTAFTALWPNALAVAQLDVVLGDHDAAAAHLRMAEAVCQRCELPRHRVRVALHRAWAAREAGREAEAAELAAPAVSAARDLEGAGVLREAALLGLA